MKTETANIINFFELSPEWQKEAISNLDEYAEEALYLEPKDGTNPVEHVLWDLNEAMRQPGVHEGFKFDAVITISNNSAMLLKISDDGDEAEYIYV